MAGRKTASVASLTFVVLSGTACFASKTDVDRLRAEVNSVHDETLLVDSVRALQMVQLLSTLRQMNDTLSALSTRITRVRAESQSGTRAVNDQLVQLQEAAAQSQQRIQEMRAALEQHNRTPPPPPPAPVPGDTTRPADTTQKANDAPGQMNYFRSVGISSPEKVIAQPDQHLLIYSRVIRIRI